METWWHQNKDGSLNLEKVREVLMRHVPQGSDAHFGLDAIMARIAALEAEKAERERQEPVATVYVKRTGFNAGIEWGAIRDGVMMNDGDPLYAHPLALREPTDDECREIADRFLCEVANAARGVRTGRAMFNAVREVMKK